MLILMSILATLQYRWLDDVSEAEKERMRARMQSSAARFAKDFDRELTKALASLAPSDPQRRERGTYADRRARWTSSALFPELVRGVFVARPDEDRRLRLFRVDEDSGECVPTAWPEDLVALRSRLEGRGRPSDALAVTASDIPALAAPLSRSGYVILWLSEAAIERKLLPDLAAKHFSGAAGLEDRLEVTSLKEPPRVIYRAGPTTGVDTRTPGDTAVDLFGQWRLRVAHPSGSLDGAVASARRRNLAVAFGTLLLLALGMTTLLVSTRRMQRLATQQLEFTAGVTHELATPLAGMRSAAQNLADGVVKDPERVREYGSLIEREGRRLTGMVDQVLTFAGMQSGKPAPVRRPVAMGEVIEQALAVSQRSLDESGFRVDKAIAPDLPEVSGDGAALRSAIENLVGNAVKYAADGAWIGLRAGVVSGRHGRWLEITVADHGPGIADADLPHVFEAFYRGRGRSAGAVPGSGLGLTLVKNIARAHGGKVTVDTTVPNGAAFTIALPVTAKAGP